MQIKRFVFVFFCFTLSCFFLTGCNKVKLESKWRDREIIIDGQNNEWQDVKKYVNDKKVAFGVFNDEDFLYLYMGSWDNELQRMMMMSGFTVWFDPEGRNKKKFGIHFPIGMRGGNPRDFMRKNTRKERGGFEDINEVMFKEMDVVSINEDENKRELLNFFREKGIEVKAGKQLHNIIYELKIPIIKDAQHPYAVGTRTNAVISICFEIPKPDFKMAKGMSGSGRPGGGEKPGGEMPRGGGRLERFPDGRDSGRRIPESRMPDGRPHMPQGFELWAKVKLSPKPSE
ncbi:MAG: hypothetical protein ABH952_11740 [Candidatus Omnitrophota bacterium]